MLLDVCKIYAIFVLIVRVCVITVKFEAHFPNSSCISDLVGRGRVDEFQGLTLSMIHCHSHKLRAVAASLSFNVHEINCNVMNHQETPAKSIHGVHRSSHTGDGLSIHLIIQVQRCYDH